MTSTWIKYSEGFYELPTGHIINKPFQVWTTTHQEVAQSMDYVECINLSMQTGVFFLLQCFWNYLSNSVAKKFFMSSWEFKFYIFWALGSAAVFPILQWYFRDSVTLREAAPQLAYSIEVLITSALGVRSHFRFKRLLNISKNRKNGSAIVEKLAYFKDMNIYMTILLFFYGSSLATLCIDGMTKALRISSNKFVSDLLIANCNTAAVLIWLVGISIFHPRRSNAINSDTSTGSKSISNNGRFAAAGTRDMEANTHINNNDDNFKNGNRPSPRIATFMTNSNKEGGGFLRAMSPVEGRKDTPKFSNTSLNVSVDDPYTNTAVNFTMVEPLKSQHQQRPSSVIPQQKHNYPLPMHAINGMGKSAKRF